MTKTHTGDADAFQRNWQGRPESPMTYWTRGEVQNQVQLAFRNHWSLFQELMSHPAHSRGKRVLEVGCGRGSLSCYFSDAGYDCTLVDLSPRAIELASEVFSGNGLRGSFRVADANELPFADRSFDVVFSIGLLEHFDEIDRPIQEQVRILDHGGLFIGYVVPKYTQNVQQGYRWICEVLKGYVKDQEPAGIAAKEAVFRSDAGSEVYLPVLEACGLQHIESDGVYPLPMISHSIDFPFSLMPPESERALVPVLKDMLAKNAARTGKHGWRCEEGFGQAFIVWGYKK